MTHSVSLRRATWPALLLFGAVALGAGCTPDIPQDPPPEARVVPVFDPATSTVPLPNNAALDAQGTLPDLPEVGQDSAAGVFADYATNIKGWLPSTAIEIPFSGALKEDSITADSIKVFELSASGAAPVEIDSFKYEAVMSDGPAKSMVTVVPKAPLAYGKTYGAVVLKSIQDDGGKNIGEPAAIFLALSKDPLVSEDGVILNSLARAQGAETAGRLEALRKGLAPFVTGLEAAGIGRDQIATVFAWSTSSDVFAELDSATATIPLPNTLALDPDGTFPERALTALTAYKAALDSDEPQARTAQVYFEQYLDRLHGWPNSRGSVPIEAPLTGDVDPTTVNDTTVQMWRYSPTGAFDPARIEDVEVSWDDENKKIVLLPAGDLALNMDYFVFVTDGVKTTGGQPIKPAIGFKMGLSDKEVFKDGASTVPSIPTESAAAIAGIQGLLAPVKPIITGQAGVTLDKVAAVWTWNTWRDPFVTLDPLTGTIPLPNAFAISQETGRVNLPTAGASGLQLALLTELNSRNGWGVHGGGWIPITGAKLDPATVTLKSAPAQSGGVVMADNGGGAPRVMGDDEVSVSYDADANVIRFNVKQPLEEDTGYVGITTASLLGENGLPAQPTPFMVFISSPHKLTDEEGKSTIAQLPDEVAPTAEGARNQYALLYNVAPALVGETRDTITNVFAFTTDNPSRDLANLRAQAHAKLDERTSPLVLRRGCEPDCSTDDGLIEDPGASFTGSIAGAGTYNLSNVAAIRTNGEFSTTMFLDTAGGDPTAATFGRIRAYADAGEETVGVTVFMPKVAEGGAVECGTAARPIRPVIVQHGIGGERNGISLPLANAMAAPEHCLATIAMDFPLHGGRTPGEASPHPSARPAASGALFLSQNLLAFNGNVEQAVIDLSVLTRHVKENGLDALFLSTGVVNTSEVGYIGQSLGGIIGTVFTGVEPEVSVSVINVAGGRLSWLLSDESNIGGGLLPALTALVGPVEGFGFYQTTTFIQWAADIIDPATFAWKLANDRVKVYDYDSANGSYAAQKNGPDDRRVPQAQILMQMAKDDQTIPNRMTEYLADTLRLSLTDSTYEAPHGFIADPTSSVADCARAQAAAWLSSGLHTGTAAYPDSLKSGACTTAP